MDPINILKGKQQYSAKEGSMLLAVSPIIENAPYQVSRGYREAIFAGNSGTCTCASSNSGPSCRATGLEEKV
ncbi:hypothetical protein HYV88_04345 [Candidatus Woesearchaeota archaeon]|nr:hypothetical protein [Candidatus Woesearchaeota archaeon]